MFFLIESQTGRNLFSAFGGVPVLTDMREGKLRCSGAFGNSILAGCFWASLMPLMVARGFQQGANRRVGGVGVAARWSWSSPAHRARRSWGILFGAIGVGVLPLRFSLRWVRRGISPTLDLRCTS